MSGSYVEVWFLIAEISIIAVTALLWFLRRIPSPGALCVASLSASGALGHTGALLALARGPASPVFIAQLALFAVAIGALAWQARTISRKSAQPV